MSDHPQGDAVPLTEEEQDKLHVAIDGVFSPLSPIAKAAMFAGRKEQRRELLRAVAQRGGHAILYGERGVGKTSLCNIIVEHFKSGNGTLALRVGCDSGDDFSTIWRKVFQHIKWVTTKQSVGFLQETKNRVETLADKLGDDIAPNDARLALESIGINTVVILDEFDRVNPAYTALMADTIKMFSDAVTPSTIILVGVADSIDKLLKEHASVERAITQVPMPRMSMDELTEIVISGIKSLSMEMMPEVLTQIVRLSNGLPHYTHLLASTAAHEAVDHGRTEITMADFSATLSKAVAKSAESIKTAYHNATRSPRPEHLYGHVLLACALAKLDQRGFFTAASVREALAIIKGKRIEIPAFSQHLNDFCDVKRGPILEKEGPKRSVRFRFINPLMQPFVVMSGLAGDLIKREQLAQFPPDGTPKVVG